MRVDSLCPREKNMHVHMLCYSLPEIGKTCVRAIGILTCDVYFHPKGRRTCMCVLFQGKMYNGRFQKWLSLLARPARELEIEVERWGRTHGRLGPRSSQTSIQYRCSTKSSWRSYWPIANNRASTNRLQPSKLYDASNGRRD